MAEGLPGRVMMRQRPRVPAPCRDRIAVGTSRSETAHVQVKNIAASLQLFRLDAGRYPTAQEGLEALVKQPATVPNWNGPYLPDATAITDPWSRPYRFAAPGKHGEVDVYTLGSDNASGGTGEARDVGNW